MKNTETIYLSDEEAYLDIDNPYKYLYDKHYLSLLLGTNTRCLNDTKDLPYPCIIKPRINLGGMSKEAYVAYRKRDIGKEHQNSNWLAQPYIEGRHYTADIILRNGEPIAFFTFLAYKNIKDSFWLFEAVRHMNVFVLRDIELLKLDYTGIINVEWIENDGESVIIDFHQRPSLQFKDISGEIISEGIKLTHNNKHKVNVLFEKTYSRVYRLPYDAVVDASKLLINTLAKLWKGVRSVQFCFENNKSLSKFTQDKYSYRYLVINGTDLSKIEAFRNFVETNGLLKYKYLKADYYKNLYSYATKNR